MDILVQTIRKEGFFALYKGSHSAQISVVYQHSLDTYSTFLTGLIRCPDFVHTFLPILPWYEP